MGLRPRGELNVFCPECWQREFGHPQIGRGRLEGAMQDKPLIRIRSNAVGELGLDGKEAAILADWLQKERSLAARQLVARMIRASTTEGEETIDLVSDDLASCAL